MVSIPDSVCSDLPVESSIVILTYLGFLQNAFHAEEIAIGDYSINMGMDAGNLQSTKLASIQDQKTMLLSSTHTKIDELDNGINHFRLLLWKNLRSTTKLRNKNNNKNLAATADSTTTIIAVTSFRKHIQLHICSTEQYMYERRNRISILYESNHTNAILYPIHKLYYIIRSSLSL